MVMWFKKKITEAIYRVFNTSSGKLSLVWIQFLVIALFLLIFSKDPTLSIDKTMNYILAFICFYVGLWFFQKKRHVKIFIYLYFFSTLILCILALVLLIVPESIVEISPMNLIYPTFGHNHLAEWLLIIIPISWWFAMESGSKIRYLFPIVFSFGLFLSFGRIALFFGLIQSLVILKYFKTKELSKYTKKIFVYCLTLLVIGVVILIILLISEKFGIFQFCQNSRYSRLVCKELDLDTRLLYFGQAFEGWKNNPIVGSGLGTFVYVSVENLQIPGYQTNYAHNNLLNLMVESGVIGFVSFYMLYGYLLVLATKIGYKSDNKLIHCILIGIYFSYLISLFDFSWSFRSIFLITTLLLVLIISSEKNRVSDSPEKSLFKKLGGVNVVILILGSIFVLFYHFLYLFLKMQYIYFDNTTNFFSPYVYKFRNVYVDSEVSKGVIERQKIYSYYKNDYRVLRKLTLAAVSADELNQYMEQLYLLHPWHQIGQNNIDYLLSINDLNQVAYRMRKIITLVHESEKLDFNYYLTVETRNNLAQKSVAVADYLYANDQDLSLAGELYVFAQSLSPWILHNHHPNFEKTNKPAEKLLFFEAISNIKSEYFGDAFIKYQAAINELTGAMIRERQFSKIPSTIRTVKKFYSEKDKTDGEGTFWKFLYSELLFQEENIKSTFGVNSLDYYLFIDMLVNISNLHSREMKSSLTYDQLYMLIKILQFVSLQALDEGKIGLTQMIVESMDILLGENYWVMAQQGHLFSLLQDKDKTIAYYEACLQRTENKNIDCLVGKNDVLNGYFNNTRFYQVSQIILGEKRWQDFQ